MSFHTARVNLNAATSMEWQKRSEKRTFWLAQSVGLVSNPA